MSSISKVQLTIEAKADLLDALHAAKQAWGDEAATFYAVHLISDVVSRVDSPWGQTIRDDIADGVFDCPSGHHVVFYRAAGAELTIFRIVHHLRDVMTLLSYY